MSAAKDVMEGEFCGMVVVVVWRVGILCFVVGTAASGSASSVMELSKLKRSALEVPSTCCW